MQDNFKASLTLLLHDEGGFVNDPDDKGGPTNKGITLRTYSSYLGRQASIDELKNIPDEHVEDIYKTRYWDLVKADSLPKGLDYFAFDFAVNSSPAQAVRSLQRVIKVTVDGILGPRTLQVIKTWEVTELLAAYKIQRMGYLRSLSNWWKFGKGWTNRVNGVLNDAYKMARGQQAEPNGTKKTTPKSQPKDISVVKSPEVKSAGTVITSAVVAGATKMSEDLEAYTSVSDYIMYAFIALVIIGGIGMIYLKIKRNKQYVDDAD
jgi:lysozyme family protein